ncbi:MAG: SseB family protein [Oscillospiraceae bacterium]|nr:SseB family protein [Oscillospiraceae bacterium]
MSFRKNETMLRTPLNTALKKFAENQDNASLQQFKTELKNLADESAWVPMLVKAEDKNNIRLLTFNSRGNTYVGFLSDNSEFKKESRADITVTDINKLLDVVFENSVLDGIVIDPYTTQFYMDKSFLLETLLHTDFDGIKTYTKSPRNWGNGIPSYSDFDIMTDEEIQNFALQIVYEYDLIQNGYQIVSITDDINAFPNIIAKKDDELVFILVRGYCINNTCGLADEIFDKMMLLSEKYRIKSFFADVGFRSSDDERFEEGLLLCGDGFYADYKGLREISLK